MNPLHKFWQVIRQGANELFLNPQKSKKKEKETMIHTYVYIKNEAN